MILPCARGNRIVQGLKQQLLSQISSTWTCLALKVSISLCDGSVFYVEALHMAKLVARSAILDVNVVLSQLGLLRVRRGGPSKLPLVLGQMYNVLEQHWLQFMASGHELKCVEVEFWCGMCRCDTGTHTGTMLSTQSQCQGRPFWH